MPAQPAPSARLLPRPEVVLAVVALMSGPALAQVATAPVGSTELNNSGRGPYYIGATQGLTYSNNVYRIPDGPSDVYSSTSLIGGLDQPIGRQRVYAQGALTYNKYRNEERLDNTSYSLGAGWNFETVHRLSGGLDLGLDQQLAAPAASTAEAPDERRNLARTQRVQGRLLWGGPSILQLETRAGWSRVDYGGDAYAGSESSRRDIGVTAYYRPGARLRVGVGVRADRTHQPVALVNPVTGATQSNDADGRHLDLIADYALTSITSVGGRVSYTRQDNSNPALGQANFSGLTGALNAAYRPTAKLSAQVALSRDTGASSIGRTAFVLSTPSTDPSTPATPSVTPQTVYFENNRIVNAASLTTTYAATAKIQVSLAIRYEVATSAGTSTGQANEDVRDRTGLASLSVGYQATRSVSIGCTAGYERRDVSGGVDFAYSSTSVGCNGQLRWP